VAIETDAVTEVQSAVLRLGYSWRHRGRPPRQRPHRGRLPLRQVPPLHPRPV